MLKMGLKSVELLWKNVRKAETVAKQKRGVAKGSGQSIEETSLSCDLAHGKGELNSESSRQFIF